METALKLEHVYKRIGKREILHDINLETYAGEVFGFLGPNGAGKTTTIKMIVGLLSTDEGKIEVAGYDIRKNFEKAMRNIGGIVENPEMYPTLTGMQNLQQYARMRYGVTQKRIQEVVELVGLSNRIQDKVKKYSLGMRQRLGVAQAILHHPKVLILDEPTNGLDPAGIKDLRDILKNLAHKENISVMVSSHLMSEMEMMCDRVGIIVRGKVIGVQTVEEMIDSAMGGKHRFVFQVNDPQKAALELSQRNCQEIKHMEENCLEISLPQENTKEQIADILEAMVRAGIRVYRVSPIERKSLEDVFLELTEEEGKQIG